MKLTRKQNKRYIVLAFLLPTALLLTFYALYGFKPFGKHYWLFSDMFHQYAPFFVEFRRALLSGDSLLWNWHVGMGIDFLGVISYYLASPLNLLCVLLPEHLALNYFSVLAPIKLGLAGGFFAIMLKKLFHRNDISLPLFGSLYGLCAWALGYHWNVMWLDSFALLPLVFLGEIYLLRDRKVILYTITLFFSIFINYYIGLFVCIFVFLCFVCYQFCRFRGLRRFFADLGRIACFSLLAIGMTAILTIPAISALQNTNSSINAFPNGFSINIIPEEHTAAATEAWNAYHAAQSGGSASFNLWIRAMLLSCEPVWLSMRIIAGNLGGSITPTFKEGLPNIHSGIFPILLGFLYLFSNKIKLREKLCAVGLLTFFGLSFTLRQLDYLWHGMHFPNMLPYRFSFLYSFVMIFMAYRIWVFRRSIKVWQTVLAGLLSYVLLLWSSTQNSDKYLTYNAVFLVLYAICLCYYRFSQDFHYFRRINASLTERVAFMLGVPREGADALLRTIGRKSPSDANEKPSHDEALATAVPPSNETQPTSPQAKKTKLLSPAAHRKTATVLIALLMLVEIFLNVSNMWLNNPASAYADYPLHGNDTEKLLQLIEEREKDNLFYRVEASYSHTLNDGPLNGYNGITAFTSSANRNTILFMERLGLSAQTYNNRYIYEDVSPVANLFLNIKYLFERDGIVSDNPYYTAVGTQGQVALLENTAYLPFGFLVESTLGTLPLTEDKDRFAFQNDLFRAATGIASNVWLPQNTPSILAPAGTDLSIDEGCCVYEYSIGNDEGELSFIYTATQEGLLCVDLDSPKSKNFTAYKIDPSNNEETEIFSNNAWFSQIFSVCQIHPGDMIRIAFPCSAKEKGKLTIRAAILDDGVFWTGQNKLKTSTLHLESFSSTHIEGKIHCDNAGLLYTSLPQNGKWAAFIDGKPVQTVLVGGVMLSIPIEAGTHVVELRYKNSDLVLGAAISLGCGMVLIAISLLVRRKSQKDKQQ